MIVSSKRRLFGLTLALVCLTAGACLAQKVELKLNLTQGQAFKVQLTQRNTGTATSGQQGVTGGENVSVQMAFLVDSVADDGTATLKGTFGKVAYSGSASGQPGAEMLFEPLGRAFAVLEGKTFQVKVARTGAVQSVTGLAEAAAAALQGLTVQPDQLREFVSSSVTQAMSEAIWKEQLADVFTIIPDHPVAVGERWSRAIAVDAPGTSLRGAVYCKILERKGGVSKVKVFQEVKAGEKEIMPGVRMTFTGTSEGTCTVDEATGLVLNYNTTANTKGRVTAGSANGGTSTPVSIRTSVSIQRY